MTYSIMNFTFSTEVVPLFYMEKKKLIKAKDFICNASCHHARTKSHVRFKDLCLAESGTHFTLSCVKTAASRSWRCIRDT